ncbi:unnamed protein product [Withania somnifera]
MSQELSNISEVTISEDGESKKVLSKKYRGKLGKPAYLDNWEPKITPLTATDVTFGVTFEWQEEYGIPGSFLIKNLHQKEFYLKTLTLDDTYLPSQTPEPLCYYREEELENLRGNGMGKLEEWNRIYDYVVNNDLGDPDKGPMYMRDILGGSKIKPAWRTDEEFAREMLAGLNSLVICSLKAIKENRLFILNYHDTLMPYLRCINTTTTKTCATRILLFLQSDGTLKPLAIELSLPHPEGDQVGAVSKVYTPANGGHEAAVWQLAKAYVAVDGSGYHQLISHWLNTHAVVEPFVTAINRQLSILHPVYKLLHPTSETQYDSLSFQICHGNVSCSLQEWLFPDQALPTDLIKRGIAVEDSSSPHSLRLLIQDYPFAVDGLEIWSAIKCWVEEYCHFYYESDSVIQGDTELQAWWKELREKGHGDKKNEPCCTIIIWVASALHAAVNFGQYPYAGYLPNRPTLSRRFIPDPGTPEYDELKTNPDKAFLKTITPQMQTLLGISLIEMLSRHTWDEVYLGQKDIPEWTKDQEPLQAFERFGKRLREIEEKITQMNCDEKWRNRSGPVKMPYIFTLPLK